MIFTADQLLPLADLVREHEVTDIHLGKTSGGGVPPDLHADLYREDDQGWRITVTVTDDGLVTTYGPGLLA